MGVKLTVLVENHCDLQALQAVHGFSILIEGPERKLLFDTGPDGDILLGNAAQLGISLSDVDGCVLSHGHRDHTGGLMAAASQRQGLTVFMHPNAFLQRWAEGPGEPMRDISCPHNRSALLRQGGEAS